MAQIFNRETKEIDIQHQSFNAAATLVASCVNHASFDILPSPGEIKGRNEEEEKLLTEKDYNNFERYINDVYKSPSMLLKELFKSFNPNK